MSQIAPAVPDDDVDAWAASGAMALTGPADGAPLGPPAPLVPRLRFVAAAIAGHTRALGREVTVDPLELLGERAALQGLSRHGQVSCGGSTRLLRAGVGWLAVALPRPSDVDAVSAWLEVTATGDDVWRTVEREVSARDRNALVERAALLGLPVAALPDRAAVHGDGRRLPASVHQLTAGGAAVPTLRDVVVADLSGLWAGPLCGHLLHLGGARVLKIESTSRPDGARRGPPAFFDLLNGGKLSVALDLATSAGVERLRQLLSRVDVVIESSRPRGLEQLGIDAATTVRSGHPRVWVAISGYGRAGAGRNRVAFGDDAAAAGGLVAWQDGIPHFVADAVADPCTGLVAAAATLHALTAGGRWLVDVALAGTSAWLAGPTIAARPTGDIAAPRARPVPQPAAPLGADNGAVLEHLGLGR